MDPAQLAPDAIDLPRLLFGTILYLAPGILLARRLAGRHPGWLVLAPVLSFSLMTLGATALHFLFGVPIQARTTAALALGIMFVVAWPVLRNRPALPRPGAIAASLRATSRSWWPAILVFAFTALVFALPHLPGTGPESNMGAYPGLLDRTGNLLLGNDDPYAVHVDEYRMIADAAEISRSGVVDISNPYTDQDEAAELFSVQGFRSERGFTLGLAQVHELTGASFPFMARVLPSLWAGHMAIALVAALRPAPGAWISGAFVAVIPTTVRFLGPGILVPSAFALAWIPAALFVGHRFEGPSRLGTLYLLVTGAYVQHLVLGTLTLAVAAMSTLGRQGRPVDRAAATLPVFLPLLWILPPIWLDVRGAVDSENNLPFETTIFLHPGLILWGLSIAGAAVAFMASNKNTGPHRTLAWLMATCAISLSLSLRADHHSDATYSRLIPTLFLCLAALAGLALGAATQFGRTQLSRTPIALRWPNAAPRAVMTASFLLAATALAAPVAGSLSTPYYRIFGDQSWHDAEILVQSGAGPDDIFLSHPWRAPMFNALTGARPHAVLYPGSAPVNDADWQYYLRSNGASEEWLHDRGINYVLAPAEPQGAWQPLSASVFRSTTPLA